MTAAGRAPAHPAADLAERRLRVICDARGVDADRVVALALDLARTRPATAEQALDHYYDLVRQRRI